MRGLHQISFRHLLAVGFLLIPALLAAVSVNGLFTLERLMAESRQGAEHAVADSLNAQRLAERTVAMERSARQFLVLGDPSLLQRFNTAAREAGEGLDALGRAPGLEPLLQGWRTQVQGITEQLRVPSSFVARGAQDVADAFRDLNVTNTRIAEKVQQAGEERNHVLLAQLEAARYRLGQQVMVAIALAALLASALAIWLARPIKRMEAAIVALGENRMDIPIEIPGPADMRLLGQRLDWLRLRLAELDEDKARFLRHVSHELKTPLAALREGVALLEEGVAGTLSDAQREVTRILRQNAMALQDQIEALLSFNAAAFEARRLTRKSTDLCVLINRLKEEQRLQWQARRLHVAISPGPVMAVVDPDKLGVAIGNLLSNAIRFSPMDGTIGIDLAQTASGVRIDIRDAGPGVAAHDKERIFEPFYRGERQPQDAVRGTGIGLSIVHEYIAAHGGQVSLLGDAPGAHFRIELSHASQS
jgi:two-component system sensor histidine kinase GlrK